MFGSKKKKSKDFESKNTLKCEERPSECAVKIMTFNFMLNAAGLIPPAKSSSLIRLAYKIFAVFTHVLYVLTVIGQVIAVVLHWGDIPLIANTMCIMNSLVLSTSTSINFLRNKTELINLVDTLKTEFVAKLKSKYMKIISNAESEIIFFTVVSALVCANCAFMWTVVPFLYTKSVPDFLNENNSTEGNKLDKLLFVMWLPFEYENSPQFEIVNTLQFLIITIAIAMLYAVEIMVLSLICHAAAQFRVLNAMLNDMHENVHEDEMHRTRSMAPLVTGTDVSNMEECQAPLNNSSSANSWNGNTKHSGSAGVELEGQKNEDCEEDPVRQYLFECIRYHQAVIK
jgi:hypothetical protein